MVEDPRVARLLTEMGAQFGQGFLFQQPKELETMLIQVQPAAQQSNERT